jgi:hypothetical protein
MLASTNMHRPRAFKQGRRDATTSRSNCCALRSPSEATNARAVDADELSTVTDGRVPCDSIEQDKGTRAGRQTISFRLGPYLRLCTARLRVNPTCLRR